MAAIQTATRPGTQHEDPRLVVYVAQSQITVEQLCTSTLFTVYSQPELELFGITAADYRLRATICSLIFMRLLLLSGLHVATKTNYTRNTKVHQV